MFHRRINRLLNIIISLCLFGFFVLFLKGPNANDSIDPSYPSFQHEIAQIVNPTNDSINSLHPFYDQAENDITSWNLHPIFGNSSLSGRDIVNSVNFLNENYEVLNLEKFGPLSGVKTVIVIQVHNRLTYLQYLIESLQMTKGIEDSLLVFSHDINLPSINAAIRNITFARVYQIFYPFNMQLFPHVFPGQDARDCAEKEGKTSARISRCQNWNSPDKYGNYRVAKLTQIKHHWWWKMNYVFDGIIDRFNLQDKWLLLLEEDHFVVPDALHVLDIITNNRARYCDKCEIISLGFYLKSTSKYGSDINRLGAHPWYSSKHNMGMALRRDSWQKIKNCSKLFCSWDDYNWDWSLMQISAKCLPERFRVIFAKSPRVLHIGDCGIHTHRCDAHNAYAAAKDLLHEHNDKLFPTDLQVTDVSRRSLKPSKENGGWGDNRDEALCHLNTNPLHFPTDDSVLSDLLHSSLNLSKVAKDRGL